MKQYLDVARKIHDKGSKRMDRTQTGTTALFGEQIRFDLSFGELPMVTTKKMFTRGITEELNWIIRADTNAKTLQDKKVKIWDEWALTASDIPEGSAFRPGDLGPIYPAMWRRIPVGTSTNWIQVEERFGLDETEMLEEHMFDAVVSEHDESTILGYVGPTCCGIEHPLYFQWNLILQEQTRGGPELCDRWKIFANFEQDVSRLPYYEQWCVKPNTYVLTCAYHNGTKYHVSNTVFASRANKKIWSESNGYELWQVKGKAGVFHSTDVSLFGNSQGDEYELLGSLMAKKEMIWRREYYIDQLAQVLESLANKKGSRRHLVTAWVPEFLPREELSPQANVLNGKAALAECHCMFQFYVEEVTDAYLRYQMWNARCNDTGKVDQDKEIYTEVRGLHIEANECFEAEFQQRLHKFLDDLDFPRDRVSCQMYQRSADTMVGVPFNITSYCILTLMVADQLDLIPGDFVHTFGDIHIYSNHNDEGNVDEQLSRKPLPLPKVKLNKVADIESYEVSDIIITGYEHHPGLSFEVAV